MYLNKVFAFVLSLLLSLTSIAWAETHSDAEPTVPEVKAEESEKPVAENAVNKALPPDVRVLIDISGSMKRTDPKNLRKPSLNMMAHLLPDKSRAGIWTFGETVNMIMPHGVVNADWRNQATQKSNQITSSSYFTNIGKALETVSFDRDNLSKDYKTHIILLTDGVVDISKEAIVNFKERQRVLAELLPSLKAAGYIIHTIALSSDADAELLKKLSVATNGAFTTANTADQLTSTFLKIFDQVVPAEQVPIENNGFLVDSSIKEFTALIFRKAGVEKSIVVAPGGKEYSDTNPQDQLNWYRTDTYDLITVENPKPGQWQIKTDITPQSRVTIFSNLQLAVQPLSANLRVNDSLPINYSFLENDKTIVNKDFLGLLEASAIISKEDNPEKTTLDFTLPTPPADGIYHQSLAALKEPGNYEVHLYIDGKTFKREFKHSFSVIDSIVKVTNNNITAADGHITHNYKISVDENFADLKKIQVTTTIKDSLNHSSDKVLNMIANNHWEFSFVPAQPAEYHVSIHAQGDLLDGSKLDETINAETFSYPLKKEEPAASAKPAVVAEEKKPEDVKKPEDNINHTILYIGIGVGNLIIFILGFFVYRMIKGDKAKAELLEVEKTLKKPVVKERREKVEEKVEEKPKAKPEEKIEPKLEETAKEPPAEKVEAKVQPKNEEKAEEKAKEKVVTPPEVAEAKPKAKPQAEPEDNLANIPMHDDLMSDGAFPLDNMDDPSKDD